MGGGRGRLAPDAFRGDKLTSQLFDRIAGIIIADGKRKAYAENLAGSILFESALAQFDPLFVTAVIRTESGFNRLAVSRVGATGLMQIMPRTRLHVERIADIRENRSVALTDTRHNIRVGIAYLKRLLANYQGNTALTLMAYNWGPARVEDAIAGTRKVPKEVIQYARKILGDVKRWSES
jgi:soluble lytic murein transglycosylase-like protein